MQPLHRKVWRILKKLKIELPYDLAIPLLGKHPEKTIVQKDTCTPMFITPLFTISKTWKQPKCPSTDECIKKMLQYIYNGILFSHKKKNEVMPFATTWMDLEIIILSEVTQTNIIWYHLYVESKIWHKWIYLWNRNRLTDIENRLVVAKGERVGGVMAWEIGVSRCKLLYIDWINNKVLLYSTENHIQYPMINHNGKEYLKKNIYIYIYNWITLLYSRN